jgi:hypothetical protein
MLPEHWAVWLFNADATGYEDGEVDEIESTLSRILPDWCTCHWPVGISQYPEWHVFPDGKTWGMVLQYIFME